jgi:alkaline phosphatase
MLETSSRRIMLLLVVLFSACTVKTQPKVDLHAATFSKRPKNIILLIGDGMALPQVSAHIYWNGVGKTIFEQFKVVGFHQSHSCRELVTDSAAGATAFSCGEKTSNGAIGVLPPKDKACPTILEDLSKEGFATGMVATCTATHATPASFIAHRELRAFTDEIALDYLKTPFDCLIAGGASNFDNRRDKLNLLDSFRQKGYVIRRGTGFKNLPMDGSKPFVVFTADAEPPTASGGRTYLPYATKLACQFLQKRSEKGFFLMVEGSQIDWAGHANDRNYLRAEMNDFDKTVRNALEFAAANGETLVIVTGDHECGGLALVQVPGKKSFNAVFSTRLHTASMVPVYAYGPQSELFLGTYQNTEIYSKMMEALGR